MANTVIINGDNRKFTISPEIKRYALIDAGFTRLKEVISCISILYIMNPLIMRPVS